MKLINLLVLLSMFVVSCGSEDTPSSSSSVTDAQNLNPSNVITATFVDSHVEGLSFQGLTSKKSGTTNSDGQFQCEIGETIQFSIGKFILGQGICQEVITPTSIYDDHLMAVKLGYVLMNLDYNNDVTDGIQISVPMQNQTHFEADLADFSGYEVNNETLEAAVFDIIKNAPDNSFFFDFQNLLFGEYSLYSVREHFKQSYIPIGRYEGEIESFSVNLPEGNCNNREFFRVEVQAKNIIFPGFAGLNGEEISLNVPRTIQPDKYRNTFNKTFDLVDFVSPNSDQVSGPRLYERAILKGTLKDGKLIANFKFGNIDNFGTFVPTCIGKAVLHKEIKEPLFFTAMTLIYNLDGRVNANASLIFAQAFNTELDTEISKILTDYLPAFKACVFEHAITEETAYLCTDSKVILDTKIYEFEALIIKKKMISNFISEELVKGVKKASKLTREMNQTLFF